MRIWTATVCVSQRDSDFLDDTDLDNGKDNQKAVDNY